MIARVLLVLFVETIVLIGLFVVAAAAWRTTARTVRRVWVEWRTRRS